nr:peptidoglycan bridge formation glycyltransferase FemA/FemB family protein [uncultured Fusobacterium sp.]
MDIYFEKEYAKLYEKIENGKIEEFILKSKNGTIKTLFLKRKIEIKVDDKEYYDIITPYGYGGPIILEENNKEELLREYNEKFSEYCIANNIVAEFIRFHPIYENALDFRNVYDIEYSRKTVGTNLNNFEDPVQEEFSKNARREIKQALKKGVKVKIIEKPENLENFKKLYYETMDRNSASEYYYFDEEYFNEMILKLKDYILLVELEYESEIIASEIYLIKGKILHAHLLGSCSKMLELNAGSLIEATAANWGKEHGYNYIHHGGGRTSDPDDSLFKYKKKFGKNTEFDFYIGKKIWDEKCYDKIVEIKENNLGKKLEGDFFPKYRIEK